MSITPSQALETGDANISYSPRKAWVPEWPSSLAIRNDQKRMVCISRGYRKWRWKKRQLLPIVLCLGLNKASRRSGQCLRARTRRWVEVLRSWSGPRAWAPQNAQQPRAQEGEDTDRPLTASPWGQRGQMGPVPVHPHAPRVLAGMPAGSRGAGSERRGAAGCP